ncbi:hypothetical protein VSDG_03114 [Cytospora chrysosperma]|uniref:Uncharacterized protein n=1 Tax=Cytospora chrysosperma TaxID=252740 RepID=A0A423W942_CYTCH|nr:hypothetical protein VSDG_03114 [Valsa sordida]
MAPPTRKVIAGLKFLLGLTLASARTEHGSQTDLSFPLVYTVTLNMRQPLPTNRGMPSSSPTTAFPVIGANRATSTSFSSITLGQQKCQDIAHDEAQYLAVGALDLEKQKIFAETVCHELSQKHIRLSQLGGDGGILHLVYFKVVDSLAYNYEIEWISDCEQTLSLISANKPLPGSDINCSTLWIDDCNACCDHSLGGYIDVGCARYTFSYGYVF